MPTERIINCATGEITEGTVAASVAPAPQLIEMRKALLEMRNTVYGGGTLLAAVEALVAAGDEDLQIEFARATQLSRTRALVIGIQGALGIDDATMDALFIAADARP